MLSPINTERENNFSESANQEDSQRSLAPLRKISRTKNYLPNPNSVANLKKTIDSAEDITLGESYPEDEEEETDVNAYLKKVIDHDTTGRSAYLEACGLMGIVPVKFFLHHLAEKSLVMKHHGLGDAGMIAVGRALRNNITIEHLDLTENGIGEEGGIAIAKLLRENEFVTRLILTDNMLRTAGVYPIFSAIQANNTLKVLNLSGNQISDDTATSIGLLLSFNRTLVELYVSRNDLGERSALSISNALASNDTLELLDLSWNKIRGKSAVELAKGIRDNVRLKRVYLGWNGFGAKGGAALAEMLAANDTLLEVDISGNRLDDRCAQNFARVFSKNENLRVLRMGYNPISTTGSIQIISGLRKSESSRLEELHLTDIKVEFEFMRIAKDIMLKRPEFVLVHGSTLRAGNTPSDIGKPGLDPRLEKHPLLVLKEHILVNDTKFLDVLRELDVNNKLAVTKEQFEQGLKSLGINYSKDQIKEIGKKLDKYKNGMIYYGDLVPAGPKKEDNLMLDAQTPRTPHGEVAANDHAANASHRN